MKTIFLKKLAAWLTYNCVRNTPIIEYLHCDGRISQEEMKNINTSVRNKIYTFLLLLEQDPYAMGRCLLQPPTYWEDAKEIPGLIKAFTRNQQRSGLDRARKRVRKRAANASGANG